MEGKVNFSIFNKDIAIPGKGKKWRDAFFNKRFSAELLLSIIIQVLALVLLANFLKFNELRQGAVLNDPLLSVLPPVDLTWLIFAIIYGCLLLALISFSKNPLILAFAFQSYSLLILIRAAAMYAVPLEPPLGMIALSDPFVEFFGTGMLLTKDLFFSGHTALLFLFFLTEKSKPLKVVFLCSAVIVGICLLLQHVHYTIDVFSAPFFSYASFKMVFRLKQVLSRYQFKNTPNG